jgi:1-deoxy-D-xylulose-5-phosphate reductoisomerase
MSPPDPARYPCLRLAQQVATIGGTAPAIFNAANEIAVSAFIEGKIAFTDIARLIEETLTQSKTREPSSLSDVLQADAEARALTTQLIQRLAR